MFGPTDKSWEVELRLGQNGRRPISTLSGRINLILECLTWFSRVTRPAIPEAEATECRKQAELCRQEAEKAISPLDRDAWLRMAGEWMNLALSAERRK
jgi:hypothetical protein